MVTTPMPTGDRQGLADALTLAYLHQLNTYQRLDRLPQCDAYWPSDPAGPNYPGTRCDFLQHPLDQSHAARIPGSSTVVSW